MSADNEKDSTRRFHSLIGTSSSSLPKQRQSSPPFPMNQLDIPQLNVPQFRSQFRYLPSPNAGLDGACRRAGMPPSHPQIPPISPYSQIPAGRPQTGLQTFTTNPGPSHTRSLSQPSSFAADSLPPLSPSPYRDLPQSSISDQILTDAAMEDVHGSPSPFSWGTSLSRINESLPPGKAHRRSKSDIPFGFMPFVQQPTSPLLMPTRSPVTLDRLGSSIDNSLPSQPVQLIKKECIWEKRVETGNGDGTDEKKSEGEVVDDFFSAYMNLENIEAFNSPGTDEKLRNDNREDLESSRASGTKTNGGDSSDNEATSSVNESLHSKREGVKRNAVEDIAPTARHYRSMSMDSFMGKMSFGDESLKMPPSPLPMAGQLSPTNSLEANSNAFSLEFGNGEFTGAEMKKIMENEKLAEIALSDPKRAKRILANRQSAARSKERKMRYIAELEHKVQTLQTEATTLSAQLTLLQRDSAGLTNQNNELKFRLQAMEQQAQLRDALNEALTAEVQRLKLTTAELTGDTSKFQQLSIGPQMFPSLRQQQAAAQLQHQQQKPSQQSNGNDPTKKNESNK